MCYDPLRFILCFLVCKPKLQDRACSLGTVTKQENCEQKKYLSVLWFMCFAFAFFLGCFWFVLAFLLLCTCFCFFSGLSSLLSGFFVFVFFVFVVFDHLKFHLYHFVGFHLSFFLLLCFTYPCCLLFDLVVCLCLVLFLCCFCENILYLFLFLRIHNNFFAQ